MRFAPISISLALWLLVSPSASAQSSPSLPTATSQPACRAYAFVQEADPRHWRDFYATPVVIPDTQILQSDYRKLEALDFPAKITPWRDRLSRDQYNSYVAAWRDNSKSHWQGLSSQEKKLWARRIYWLTRPKYNFVPVSDDDAERAEKYVAQHANELPGICSDQAKATYILEIARINFSLEGLVALKPAVPKLIEVQEWRDRGAYDGFGGSPDENYRRSHSGEPSPPGEAPHVGFTCVYLYKLEHAVEKGRHPGGHPDFYYCPYGFRFGAPLTEMLRFVSQSAGP